MDLEKPSSCPVDGQSSLSSGTLLRMPPPPAEEELEEEPEPELVCSLSVLPARDYLTNFERNYSRQLALYKHLLPQLTVNYVGSTFLTARHVKNTIALGVKESSNSWGLAIGTKTADINTTSFIQYDNDAGSSFTIKPVRDEAGAFLKWIVRSVCGPAFADVTSAASSSPSSVVSISSSSSSSSLDGAGVTSPSGIRRREEIDELLDEVDELEGALTVMLLDDDVPNSVGELQDPNKSSTEDDEDDSATGKMYDIDLFMLENHERPPLMMLELELDDHNSRCVGVDFASVFDVPQSNPTPPLELSAISDGWQGQQPLWSYNLSAPLVLPQIGLGAVFSGHLPSVLQKQLASSATGYGSPLAEFMHTIDAGEGAKKAIDFLTDNIPAHLVRAKGGETADQIEIENENQRKELAKCWVACMDTNMLCRVTDENLKGERFRKALYIDAFDSMSRNLLITSAMAKFTNSAFALTAADEGTMFATLLAGDPAPLFTNATLQSKRKASVASSSQSLADRFSPLSLDDMSQVIAFLDARGLPGDIVAKIGSDSLSRANLRTLLPGCWLSDEIMHLHLRLLRQRDKRLCNEAFGRGEKRRETMFFKSFFFTKLLEGSRKYDYNAVKNWREKAGIPDNNLFDLERIIIPVNMEQVHWCCACVFVQKKIISFYDSLGSHGEKYTGALLKYMKDEWKSGGHKGIFPKAEWTIVQAKGVPKQHNGYDCGVFTCAYADSLSIGIDLSFTQRDIVVMRNRLVLALCKLEAD